jgi:hypothetical protein
MFLGLIIDWGPMLDEGNACDRREPGHNLYGTVNLVIILPSLDHGLIAISELPMNVCSISCRLATDFGRRGCLPFNGTLSTTFSGKLSFSFYRPNTIDSESSEHCQISIIWYSSAWGSNMAESIVIGIRECCPQLRRYSPQQIQPLHALIGCLMLFWKHQEMITKVSRSIRLQRGGGDSYRLRQVVKNVRNTVKCNFVFFSPQSLIYVSLNIPEFHWRNYSSAYAFIAPREAMMKDRKIFYGF